MTNEYNKGAVRQISNVFGRFNILLFEASSETRLFRHLSDYVFGVRNFENANPMRVILFSKMFKI